MGYAVNDAGDLRFSAVEDGANPFCAAVHRNWAAHVISNLNLPCRDTC